MQDWLFETGSLTRRLRRHCDGGFRLRLQSLRHARPRNDEAMILELPPGQRALLREVYLLCGERIAVYARSVIPLDTLRGATARLAHLGPRPLADVLFANRKMQRGPMQFALLTQGHALHGPAGRGFGTAVPLWARRTVFSAGSKRLLVAEVFAPWLSTEAG